MRFLPVLLAGLLALGPVRAADGPCGMRPGDWCPAPVGDPCGRHPDVAACRADSACRGMAYRGESVVACQLDPRGFGQNCPTVGCISAGR
jgi:hypothetical protein